METIESWRELLAKNLALRNPKLTQRELNYAVQVTIDRIIFLRMCEDRGIETDWQLQGLQNGPGIYGRLKQLFVKADERYNSGLFYFHKEPERSEPPDELTPALKIDDRPLQEIIQGLYYPESPYEFSVLPAEILGHVYEQFLGKVIRLTAGHQARVEDKPEVKKAGGVYYTPTYIVDYIVKHTVGRLLPSLLMGEPLSLPSPSMGEGQGGGEQPSSTPHPNPPPQGGRGSMTPKQASKLRIIDPACGSGSFLLGAYQYLLDWHLDWYLNNELELHGKELYQGAGGIWRLTTAEKKRILLNNIYGVDIDPQAVEVTKLSLLLKVLEGESKDTLERQRLLFHERALPDLASNIKCGNSLIGSDFYQGRQLEMFDQEERNRINVFDWEERFPKIMKGGGFDVVIGNPPYGALIGDADADYLQRKFEATTKDLDSYCLFMEQAIRLSKPDGRFSMIVPTGWYSGPKFTLLRRFIACNTDPERFVNLPYDVFRAWVDTTVFVVAKREKIVDWPRVEPCNVQLRTFPKRHDIKDAREFEEELRSGKFTDWFTNGNDEYLTYADSGVTLLIRKIQERGRPLELFSDVQRGITPFQLTESATHASSRRAFAGTVRRYRFEKGPVRYIRFDHTIAEPKPERYFKGPRLLLRELISRQFQLQAVKVAQDFVTNKSMQSILPLPGVPHLNYVLGVLNSRLMSWYFLRRSQVAQRDDFPKIVLKETRGLPIRQIDDDKKSDRVHHDRMVELVDHMLSLHKQLPTAKTPHEQTALQEQIDHIDRQIDRLVYELYGLTEEEIKIVEKGVGT